jgi:hypothetical protein
LFNLVLDQNICRYELILSTKKKRRRNLNLRNEVSLGEEIEGEDKGVGSGNESRGGSGVVKEVSGGSAWNARRRVRRA